MYIFEDMIDLGLLPDQTWPKNEAYRVVAQKLGLNNPNCFSRDYLTELVQAVLAIPEDMIAKATLRDMVYLYKIPHLNL